MTAAPPEKGQARTLAAGSLAQWTAQLTGLLSMFAIVTVLARKLSLSELGAYGLLNSLAGYLLIVQNAGAGAAVRDMAAAPDQDGRDSVYSTAAFLYLMAGLIAGVLVALLGIVLAGGMDLSADATHQVRVGSLLLGGVTAIGWPITVTRDALRARQLFVRAAMTETAALVVYVALVLGLAFSDAGLSLVIGASGTIPLLSGLGCAVVARTSRVPFRLRRRSVRRSVARAIVGTAGYLSLTEAFAASIYALNRALLGLFKSAATVGLFEGPIRAHNLVRALNSAETVTTLPTAARYQAEGDDARLTALLVRGTRYTLALVVPIAVTAMLLGGPILRVWLGPGFGEAGGALAILLSHWLVSGCTGVLIAILVAVGRAADVARWAGALAVLNLLLALALIPVIGLEGAAVATAAPYLALFPVLLRMALRRVPVPLGSLVREAFLPAYVPALVLAGVLGAIRLAVDVHGLGMVAALALAAPLAYWLAYYGLWLRPEERRLVREVAGDLLPVSGGRRRAAGPRP
ncbi:MAG TPA: oligosaccharide flippase family protein [Thermoleophilaceae bacterium]